MTNKNKLLKTISMAAIGFLALGNYSNIWMMEKPKKSFKEIKAHFQDTSKEIKADLQNTSDRVLFKEMINSSINNLFGKITNNLFEKMINNLKAKYENDQTAVEKVSEELNELLGKKFNKTDDLSAIPGVSVLLAEHIVHYSNNNVKNIKLIINRVMPNISLEFPVGFSDVAITNIIEKLKNIAKEESSVGFSDVAITNIIEKLKNIVEEEFSVDFSNVVKTNIIKKLENIVEEVIKNINKGV